MRWLGIGPSTRPDRTNGSEYSGRNGSGSATAWGADLVLDGVASGYSSVPVIRRVSLEAHPGEVVALMGANGAGKTTTLLTICGEIALQEGTITLDGRPFRGPLYRRAQNGLSLITEERSAIMSLTCRQNLRLGRGSVEAALAVVPELEPLLDREAGLLSGGEQQLLTMARALARRPRIVLADEVSLGLAPLLVKRLLAEVRNAADAGATVLLVEQHTSQVLEIADRGYILNRGQIVLAGEAQELRRRRSEIEAAYISGVGSSTASGPASSALGPTRDDEKEA